MPTLSPVSVTRLHNDTHVYHHSWRGSLGIKSVPSLLLNSAYQMASLIISNEKSVPIPSSRPDFDPEFVHAKHTSRSTHLLLSFCQSLQNTQQLRCTRENLFQSNDGGSMKGGLEICSATTWSKSCCLAYTSTLARDPALSIRHVSLRDQYGWKLFHQCSFPGP